MQLICLPHIPVCCHPLGIILMTNMTSKDPENRLIPHTFQAKIAPLFVEDADLAIRPIFFAWLSNHSKLVWTIETTRATSWI